MQFNEEQTREKRAWSTPKLIIHGDSRKITQKNKTYGDGDDVLVNNQAILANLS